jgi:hypothetical protein
MTNRPADQLQHDDHFEKHLRELRPIAPRALPIPQHRARWTTLAIAALLLLAAGSSFFARQSRPPRAQQSSVAPPVTIGTLNAAWRDSDDTFNRLLDDASPNILPHSHQGTVLDELGKE